MRATVPVGGGRSPLALVWLTDRQEAKIFPLRIFLRSSLHRKRPGGEAVAAGELYLPGGWPAAGWILKGLNVCVAWYTGTGTISPPAGLRPTASCPPSKMNCAVQRPCYL